MRTWWVAFIPLVALPGASYSGPDVWTEPDRIEIPHLTYRWNHDARPDADPGMKGSVVVEIDNLVLRKLRYATMWSFGGGTFKISGGDLTWSIGQHAVGDPLPLVDCKETATVTWSGAGTFTDRTSPGTLHVGLDPKAKSFALSFGLPAHLHAAPNNDGCIPPPVGQSYQSRDNDTLLTVAIAGTAEFTPPSGLKLDLDMTKEAKDASGHVFESWQSTGKARVAGLVAKIVPDRGTVYASKAVDELGTSLVARAAWYPEGPTPRRDHGNEFTAHLEIVDDQGKPVNPTVTDAVVTLAEDTHHPGVCSNWPRLDDPAFEKNADLFFDPARNPDGHPVGEDKLSLEGVKWRKPFVISSRDFGGFAKVKAVINIPGKPPLDAEFDGKPSMSLPIDDDGNRMSDAVTDFLGVQPDDDLENAPAMSALGDGIKALDEYRGFFVSTTKRRVDVANTEAHERLKPTRRELFVAIDCYDDVAQSELQRGIALFERAWGSPSQVAVFYVAAAKRFDTLDGDTATVVNGVAEFKDMPRRMAPDSVFASKTAGVWVTTKHAPHTGAVATAISMAEIRRGLKCDDEAELPDCINNPRFTRYVGVDLALDSHQGARDFFDPAAKPGGPNTEAVKMKVLARALHDKVDLARIVANARGPGFATQKQQTRVFAVAHELGHALGASHHDFFKPADPNPFVAQASGAFSCPMRYWQNLVDRDFPALIAFFDSRWDPSIGAVDGTAYQFCTDNLKQMSLQP